MQTYKIRSYFTYILFFLIILLLYVMIIRFIKYNDFRFSLYTSIGLILPAIVILFTPYRIVLNLEDKILKINYFFRTKIIDVYDLKSVDIFYWNYKLIYINSLVCKNKKFGFLGKIKNRDKFIENLLKENNKIKYKFHNLFKD